MISSRLPGNAACAACAWSAGMTESRAPATISVGRSPPRRGSRSSAHTVWPRTSTTERSVRMKACRTSGSRSAAYFLQLLLHPGSVFGPGSEQRHDTVAQEQCRPRREHRQQQLGAGCCEQPQRHADVGAQPAAVDQNEASAVLAMLVRELQRDAAAERVPDKRGRRDVELVEEIAQPHRERAQRVVGAGLVGPAVAEQIRCDHPVLGSQRPDDRNPRTRTAGHPVDQQQRLGCSVTLLAVGDAVAVQIREADVTHVQVRCLFGCVRGRQCSAGDPRSRGNARVDHRVRVGTTQDGHGQHCSATSLTKDNEGFVQSRRICRLPAG